MFLGLRTVIYPAPDLDASKAWYAKVLGFEPYFDEPFYVGFDVGGYELGTAFAALLDAGATERSPVTDVGGGIKVATLIEPSGAVLGIIENPHFRGGG